MISFFKLENCDISILNKVFSGFYFCRCCFMFQVIQVAICAVLAQNFFCDQISKKGLRNSKIGMTLVLLKKWAKRVAK